MNITTREIKVIAALVVGIIIFAVIMTFNTEVVQKKVYDAKADLVGSNRTISFYTPISAEKVASYSDKDLRYEVSPNGETISVWLGSVNKKVHSNMGYIIEDK